MAPELSHIDEHGRASMVDVTGKPATLRRAEARAMVIGVGDLGDLIGGEQELFGGARVAGLAAAKLTSRLIPLCHPLPLTDCSVEFELGAGTVEVRAITETIGQTGVEMEALTACAAAALSIVAGLGSARPAAVIEGLTLWEKTGGKSGHWRRDVVSGTVLQVSE